MNKTMFRLPTVSKDFVGEHTGNFDDKNFIADFQFGKVYRGQSEFTKNNFTVKIWDDKSDANRGRFLDEIYLLQHEQCSWHPGFMKLKAFACREVDDKLAVEYSDVPLDTLYNLVDKDSFTWLHRIKAALGLASVLKFLHAKDPPYEPYLVRNIDAAHILIDEDYSAKLLDVGRISGGIFPNAPHPIESSSRKFGYNDPFVHEDEWSRKSDVFAFGIILLMLITKRVDKDDKFPSDAPPSIYEWARNQLGNEKSTAGFRKFERSLVHNSLEAQQVFESSDGLEISNLALRCVLNCPQKRPPMKSVMKSLQQLSIVQHNAQFLGLDDLICDVYYKAPVLKLR